VFRADPPSFARLAALRKPRNEIVNAFERPVIGGIARQIVLLWPKSAPEHDATGSDRVVLFLPVEPGLSGNRRPPSRIGLKSVLLDGRREAIRSSEKS
jgi:hypothetical protein